MKKRLVPLALTAALLLAFGAIAAACGGGGDKLTLEEYFQELEALGNTFETRSGAIDATVEGLSDEEFLERAPDVFGEQGELVGEFVDGLSELDPPEEAAELLDEAVSAGRDVEELFGGLVDEVEAAKSIGEVIAVFETEEFNAAIERFDQACLDAEQLAADNGLAVDLYCNENE